MREMIMTCKLTVLMKIKTILSQINLPINGFCMIQYKQDIFQIISNKRDRTSSGQWVLKVDCEF